MRRLTQASRSLAVVVVAAVAAGCGGDRGSVRPSGEESPDAAASEEALIAARPVGRELMAQEAPPAVGRPIYGERGPRRDPNEVSGRYPFYWTRAIYSGFGRRSWGRRPPWSTDYPKGDQQFLVVLKRLVRLNAYDWDNAVSLADPDLRRFPVVYAVEVGYMDLPEEEVLGLRSYLEAGGFLIVDDFWGSREWEVFLYNIQRVLPDRAIVELELDHPLFSAYYDIDEIMQVPARGRGINGWGTYEQDGRVPHVRGIYDDAGRLMVLINWNTDLGDAWEWAESPDYPLVYSTYAYEVGANMIIYAMSH